MNKSLQIKIVGICKTKAKKWSPDMFNFYAVFPRLDKVSDVCRATRCRRNFEGPSLQTKKTKNEGPPENMGFNGKPFEGFRRKKRTETILSVFEKKPVEYKDPERIK